MFINHIDAKVIEPVSTDWQKQLRETYGFHALSQLMAVNENTHSTLLKADNDFKTRAPEAFVKRIDDADPTDPLLLQILPRTQELDQHPESSQDPVGDHAAIKVDGLLHKYAGRVLLITTGACAIHCRYCFRRHFPYSESHIGGKHLIAAIDYIKGDDSISEVILSGGDPLMLSNKPLENIISKIQTIPHIKRLRIHTRMPIVVPDRVNQGLLECLNKTSLQTVVVIHANHANEIDDSVAAALFRLHETGATLLNQSVLLKDINDDSAALAALSERLFECKTLPYYLHMLDRVKGAHHFAVADARALKLMQELREKLPGYLVPKLVREISGKNSKIPLV